MPFDRSGMTHVARKFVPITPSDTVPLAAGATGLYVGGAGNVTCKDIDNNNTTFTAVPVGNWMPISPKFVMATNTTATLIVAVY